MANGVTYLLPLLSCYQTDLGERLFDGTRHHQELGLVRNITLDQVLRHKERHKEPKRTR